jgi:ABC-type polysaccharide/polyol phosphate transport system ATPase subunit
MGDQLQPVDGTLNYWQGLLPDWWSVGSKRSQQGTCECRLEKSRARLEKFIEFLVLASHSERIIRQWCNKAIFLNGGRMETAALSKKCCRYRVDL